MMIAMLSVPTSKKVTAMIAAVCVTVAVSSVVFSVRAEAIGFQVESFEAAPQALSGAPSFSPGTLRADPVRQLPSHLIRFGPERLLQAPVNQQNREASDKGVFGLATGDRKTGKKDDGEGDGSRLTFAGHASSSQIGSTLQTALVSSSANCPLCQGVPIGPVISVSKRQLDSVLQQHAVKQDAIKTQFTVAATVPHQSVAVPIPGSLTLFAAGFAGLLVWHRHA
jgi:hypothetical protein